MDNVGARLGTALDAIAGGRIRRVADDRPVTVAEMVDRPMAVETIRVYYAALDEVMSTVLDPRPAIDDELGPAAHELLAAWRSTPPEKDVVLAFTAEQNSLPDRDFQPMIEEGCGSCCVRLLIGKRSTGIRY